MGEFCNGRSIPVAPARRFLTQKQAVRLNPEQFQEDFLFELTVLEFENWRSRFVITKADRQGLRHIPMAFTEQGVVMLLNGEAPPRRSIGLHARG